MAHNEVDLVEYRPQAQQVADYCQQWGMRYRELLGSDGYVRKLVEVAADLSQADENFLVIPPGGELRQAQFMRGL